MNAPPQAPCRLVLASASPRRRAILASLGLVFEAAEPEVDETIHVDDPRRTAAVNAARKHRWGRDRFPGAAIIAADTVIDFDGRCILKPADLEEAAACLRAFSGRTHRVLTGVALSTPGTGMELQVDVSEVRFRRLSQNDIRAYFARVDPMDKAGAYDIDQHPELIIDAYTGSRTNIMGLAEETVRAWLERQGRMAARADAAPRPG
jgi:septum formation protein